MNFQTLDRIRANDHLTIARVITQIENDENIPDEFFINLYAKEENALRIGVTGPPGAGKSTLVDQLIRQFTNGGKSVGIVAVDPNSPFSGGAFLGDRVRMNRYVWNENVFIRSMGSHGDLGGLARKAQDVGDVLAASRKDVIIFETVGVGQGEYDVALAVDLTIVVLVPESGDDIQLMKAGLIEIADLFVINKSDREGAGRITQLLRNILHTFTKPGKLEPPVFNTVATQNEGIDELYAGILTLVDKLNTTGTMIDKKNKRHRNRVLHLVRERLLKKFWSRERLAKLDKFINSLKITQKSPHEVARALLSDF